MTADRIVRCNPAAFFYHLRHKNALASPVFSSDGRIVDEVPKLPIPKNSGKKSPILAAGLSAVIPGMGRVYSRRSWDGFFGLLICMLSMNTTYSGYKNGNTTGVVLFGFSTMIFFSGEIFGAYRAAAEFSD